MHSLSDSAIKEQLHSIPDQTPSSFNHHHPISPWPALTSSSRIIKPSTQKPSRKTSTKFRAPQSNRASQLRQQKIWRSVRMSTNPQQTACPSHRQYKINSMQYTGQLQQPRKSCEQAKRLLGGLYVRLLKKKNMMGKSEEYKREMKSRMNKGRYLQRMNKQNSNKEWQENGIFSRQISILKSRLALTLNHN